MPGIGQPAILIDPAKNDRGTTKAFDFEERRSRSARNSLIDTRAPRESCQEQHHRLLIIGERG